jgi:hypothetical protein
MVSLISHARCGECGGLASLVGGCTHLTRLQIERSRIPAAGARALGDALGAAHELEEIRLMSVQIMGGETGGDDRAAAAVALAAGAGRCCRNGALRRLFLADMGLGDGGVAAFAGAAAVVSYLAAVLAEIYLCNACSYQELLRDNGRGQRLCCARSPTAVGRAVPRVLLAAMRPRQSRTMAPALSTWRRCCCRETASAMMAWHSSRWLCLASRACRCCASIRTASAPKDWRA